MLHTLENKVRQAILEIGAATEQHIRAATEQRIRIIQGDAAEQIREARAQARAAQEEAHYVQQRADAVVAQLKRQNEDLVAEKYAIEKQKHDVELRLAEVECLIQRGEEMLIEEQARHAVTMKERDELQEDLEATTSRLLLFEVDNSLPRRFWPEHRFCKRCEQPYLEWNEEEYKCLVCDQ